MLCLFVKVSNLFSEPPSAPVNVSVIFADQSTVILTWLPPEKLGGRTDIIYRIKCDVCSLGLVQYHPNTVKIILNIDYINLNFQLNL